MEDIEFDVLDELYFVQSFDDLQHALDLPLEQLLDTLSQLIERGWVKCFQQEGSDEVVNNEEINLPKYYNTYQYLATKEGLLAHNSR